MCICKEGGEVGEEEKGGGGERGWEQGRGAHLVSASTWVLHICESSHRDVSVCNSGLVSESRQRCRKVDGIGERQCLTPRQGGVV